MLFYARSHLYSSTRRVVTKAVRSSAHAPAALIPQTATPGPESQHFGSATQPVTARKTRFQSELPLSRRRANRESGMETFRRLVMYYMAPPQLVHFPEERVKQASYSYRKSMRRPYQTSLQYKIQRGIHAIRSSSAHYASTS